MQYALPGSTSFQNRHPKRARGPTVGADLQPEALALSKENSPISSWFHSISYKMAYNFHKKAAITLNDVDMVSRVNLLMNMASHWYQVFKNHNGWSRTALRMPRNKADSKANGFTETTSASRPIPKQKLAHIQFLLNFYIFFFYSKPWGILDIS